MSPAQLPHVLRADIIGTIVFALVILVWIVNALRGIARAVALRRRQTWRSASTAAGQSAPLETKSVGAQRSPLQGVFRRLSSASSAAAAGAALRPQPAPSVASPAPSALGSAQALKRPAGPPAAALQRAAQTPAYVAQFASLASLRSAVIAAIVLEPCAAHKGAGHEPGDW
jgi:hypothetical protein